MNYTEPLYEKYRPRTLADVVGQPKACQTIRTLAEQGALTGRAFWISGKSGTGKTTLARIIAGMIADPHYTVEYDSADQVHQAELNELSQTMQYYGLGPLVGRAWIINEAHGLRAPIIRQLLGVLERLPAHVVIIFTTTRAGQKDLFDDQIDAHPLLSRCIELVLTTMGLAPAFAEAVRLIAEREGLNGKPPDAYLALANRHGSNMRYMLQDVQAGKMLA